MRPGEEVSRVLELAAAGLNNCDISRRTGIPRTTVRDWRSGTRSRTNFEPSCPDCGHPPHDPASLPAYHYSYLLGMYLGDGTISRHARAYCLRITLDERYPVIILQCKLAMKDVLEQNRVSIQPLKCRAVEVHSYSKQWPCLFPQHGPGMKYTRKIELVDWQQKIVTEWPEEFLRGLIHSDGCRSMNSVRYPHKVYRYSRYTFSNASADIRGLFCATCDQLGIEWRQMNARNISVARRGSVARMDEFIGPKC